VLPTYLYVVAGVAAKVGADPKRFPTRIRLASELALQLMVPVPLHRQPIICKLMLVSLAVLRTVVEGWLKLIPSRRMDPPPSMIWQTGVAVVPMQTPEDTRRKTLSDPILMVDPVLLSPMKFVIWTPFVSVYAA
jgi:hypothetical protein